MTAPTLPCGSGRLVVSSYISLFPNLLTPMGTQFKHHTPLNLFTKSYFSYLLEQAYWDLEGLACCMPAPPTRFEFWAWGLGLCRTRNLITVVTRLNIIHCSCHFQSTLGWRFATSICNHWSHHYRKTMNMTASSFTFTIYKLRILCYWSAGVGFYPLKKTKPNEIIYVVHAITNYNRTKKIKYLGIPQESSSRDFLIFYREKSNHAKSEKFKPMLAKVSATQFPSL